jgi:hypothetical protein
MPRRFIKQDAAPAETASAYELIEPGVFIFPRKEYFRLRFQLAEDAPSAALMKFYNDNRHHLEGALNSLPAGEADILRAFLMASWKKGRYGTQETASTLNGYETRMVSRDGITMYVLSPSYVRGCVQRLHQRGILQKLAIAGEGGRASKVDHFFLVSPKQIATLFDFGSARGIRGWTGGRRRMADTTIDRVVSTPIQVALYKIHDVLDAAIGYGKEIINLAVKKVNRARTLATEVVQCFLPPVPGGKRLSTSAGGIQSSEYFVFFTGEEERNNTIDADTSTSREINCNVEDTQMQPPLIRRRRPTPTETIELPAQEEIAPPAAPVVDDIVSRLAGTVLGAKLKTYAATLVRGDRAKARKKLAKATGERRTTDPLADERAAFQQALDAACDAVGVTTRLRMTATEFGALSKNHLRTGAIPDLPSFLAYTLSHWEANARREAEAVKRKVAEGHPGWSPLSPSPNTADIAYRTSKLIRSFNNHVAEGRVVAIASVSVQQQQVDVLNRELQQAKAQVKRLAGKLADEREVSRAAPTTATGGVTSAPTGFRYDDNGFLQPTE